MKKIIFVAFLLLLFMMIPLSSKKVKAETYRYFQTIDFENEQIVMMDEWTSHEAGYFWLANFKRKMFGWNVFYSYRREPFTYVSDTLYHVKNNGLADLEHTFKYEESIEETIQKNVSGSLELSGSGTTKKKFKYGLEGQLEYEYEKTSKTKITQTDQIKVTVSPNSTLNIQVLGEGYFYQGIAEKYFLWMKVKKGGFEYVVITTEYYSINISKNGE